MEKLNLRFILSRSWFSKVSAASRALFGLKMRPAMLNSLSKAAEAGRGVLSLTDNLRTTGNVLRILMCWVGQVRIKLLGSAWCFVGTFQDVEEVSLIRWARSSICWNGRILQLLPDVVQPWNTGRVTLAFVQSHFYWTNLITFMTFSLILKE